VIEFINKKSKVWPHEIEEPVVDGGYSVGHGTGAERVDLGGVQPREFQPGESV